MNNQPNGRTLSQYPQYQMHTKKKSDNNEKKDTNLRVLGFFAFLIGIGIVLGVGGTLIWDKYLVFHEPTRLIANRDITLKVPGGLDCPIKKDGHAVIDLFGSDDVNGSSEPNDYIWVHSTDPDNQCSGRYTVGPFTFMDWRKQ